jgi:hypothetical protein
MKADLALIEDHDGYLAYDLGLMDIMIHSETLTGSVELVRYSHWDEGHYEVVFNNWDSHPGDRVIVYQNWHFKRQLTNHVQKVLNAPIEMGWGEALAQKFNRFVFTLREIQ